MSGSLTNPLNTNAGFIIVTSAANNVAGNGGKVFGERYDTTAFLHQ